MGVRRWGEGSERVENMFGHSIPRTKFQAASGRTVAPLDLACGRVVRALSKMTLGSRVCVCVYVCAFVGALWGSTGVWGSGFGSNVGRPRSQFGTMFGLAGGSRGFDSAHRALLVIMALFAINVAS